MSGSKASKGNKSRTENQRRRYRKEHPIPKLTLMEKYPELTDQIKDKIMREI